MLRFINFRSYWLIPIIAMLCREGLSENSVFYKKDGEGAFIVKVPVPSGIPRSECNFVALSDDSKLFMLYAATKRYEPSIIESNLKREIDPSKNDEINLEIMKQLEPINMEINAKSELLRDITRQKYEISATIRDYTNLIQSETKRDNVDAGLLQSLNDRVEECRKISMDISAREAEIQQTIKDLGVQKLELINELYNKKKKGNHIEPVNIPEPSVWEPEMEDEDDEDDEVEYDYDYKDEDDDFMINKNPLQGFSRNMQSIESVSVYIYGRFRGSGPAVIRVVSRHNSTITFNAPDIVLPEKDGGNPAVAAAWMLAQNNAYESLTASGGDMSYYKYCLVQRDQKYPDISSKFKVQSPLVSPSRRGRRSNAPDVDFFSVLTGGLAIQESLQLNVMLQDGANSAETRSHSISQIEGPQIKSHPFDDMIAGYHVGALPESLRALAFELKIDPEKLKNPEEIKEAIKSIEKEIKNYGKDALSHMLTDPDTARQILNTVSGFKELILYLTPKPPKTPVIFDISRLVPEDNYYFHATRLSALFALSDFVEDWGDNILCSISVESRDYEIQSKIMNQLCIETSALSRLFGDAVIDDVALTGSDPFIREGADVSIIFKMKNKDILFSLLDGYRKNAADRRKDALSNSVLINGVEVISLATPDRIISSYRCVIDDYCVVSNSLEAIHKIIDASKTVIKPLKESSDFRYMRTIFQGDPKNEDAFLYLSDAFIRKMVGPKWKIARMRRIYCVNSLRMISNAMLFARAEKAGDLSYNDLVSRRYLDETKLYHSDGGAYSIQNGVPVHSVYGRIGYLKPINEFTIETASESEKQGYGQFVNEYNRLWSQYFDPVGIRFNVSDTHIQVETCILPLIETSLYNGMRDFIGGEPVPVVKPGHPSLTSDTLATLALKLDVKNNRSMSMGITEAIRELKMDGVDPKRWLGSLLSINVCDDDPLLTLEANEMGGQIGFDSKDMIVAGTVFSAITLPMYLTWELTDPKLAAVDIERTIRQATDRMRSEESGRGRSSFFTFYAFETEPYKGVPVGALTFRLFVAKIRLYYAIVNNQLIVSTKRRIIQSIIDASGNASQPAEIIPANAQLALYPQAAERMKPTIRTGWLERMAIASYSNLPLLSALYSEAGYSPDGINNIARNAFGYIPYCPGGQYLYNPQNATVESAVFGHSGKARQPLEMSDDWKLMKLLVKLTSVSTSLRFTTEGIMTRVDIRMKPSSASTGKN